MAKQEVREKHEQGMLNNIGGRDEPAAEPAAPAAPKAKKPIGWMVYVGSVLWATFLCGAGLVAWLVIAKVA